MRGHGEGIDFIRLPGVKFNVDSIRAKMDKIDNRTPEKRKWYRIIGHMPEIVRRITLA